jgi:hypothetical protein
MVKAAIPINRSSTASCASANDQAFVSRLDDHSIEPLQPVVMKGRHQAALQPPRLRGWATRNGFFERLVRGSVFTIIPPIVDQDVVDVIRMVDQVSGIGSRAITYDVAVLAGNRQEIVERVPHQLTEVATGYRRVSPLGGGWFLRAQAGWS